MILEFRVLSLKQNSKELQKMEERLSRLRNENNLRHEMKNEFIIVGEQTVDGKEYFKVNQLNKEGLSLFPDIDIADVSLTVPKEELEWDGSLYTEIDIPKENLSVDTVDNILKLNM